MDVTRPQVATPTPALAANTPQTTAALSSDFETFLKMLTAQARFQDPLEPIDSSEYAAQLAQFSMVEQQVLSNDLLTSLTTELGTGNLGQLAALIGMEARSTAAVSFDGAPITIQPKIETGADEAVLIAYGSDGLEKMRQQIATTGAPLQWEGRQADGTLLPSDSYNFKVESRTLGQTTGTNDAQSFERITETRREGTDSVLVLKSGASVKMADVSAVRERPNGP